MFPQSFVNGCQVILKILCERYLAYLIHFMNYFLLKLMNEKCSELGLILMFNISCKYYKLNGNKKKTF